MNKLTLVLMFLSSLVYAGTYTPNYNLYKPALGDRDYVTPFATGMTTIDTQLYNLNTATATIYGVINTTAAAITAETARAIAAEAAIAVSTGINTVNISAIAVDTGTLTVDIATEISDRGIADAAIAVSTGTNLDRIEAIAVSTGAIQDSLEAVILSTQPLVRYANWDEAYGWGAPYITSTAALQIDIDSRVLDTGDYMTGQLTLLASSLTVNGMGQFTSTVAIGANSYPVEQCSAGYILTGDGFGNFQCQPQPAAAGLTFIIDGDSGDVANYRSMVNVSNYVPGTRSTTTITDVQVDQYVSSVVTNVGVPGITYIPAGTNICHVRVKASAANRVKIKCEIYKRDLAGTETELIMSNPSAYIPTSETPITHTFVSPGFTLLITDRIVRKYKVTAVDGPATNLEFYYNGAEGNQTNSRLELPSSAVDMSQFIPYTGANSNADLGAHNLTASSITSIGDITGVNFYGAGGNLTGVIHSTATGDYLITVASATALKSNPTDCGAGEFATSIDALGNLTCAAPAGAGDVVLASTQTFTGANTFTSSVTLPTRDKITFGNELHNSSTTISMTITDVGSSTLGPCITGSTLTITTHGGPVMVWYTGSGTNSTGDKEWTATVIKDGVYTAQTSMASGAGYSTTGPFSLKFQYLMPTSAGTHSFCLSYAVEGGTLKVGQGGTLWVGPFQFGVMELR